MGQSDGDMEENTFHPSRCSRQTKEEEIYMKKRVLAVLLSLCMVLCMIPMSVSAAETETETPKSYVALGDSIPAGYGLEEGENPYPQQLAETYSYKLDNLAVTGMTSATLLTEIAKEDVLAKVTAADVITITVGGNDLMNALYTFLLNKYNATQAEDKKLTLQNLQEMLAAGDSTMLAFAVTAVKDFAESEEATGALATFTENLVGVVTAIKVANPDVAIYMTNQYNPYSYVAAENAANPVLGDALKAVADAFESGVTALNRAIAYTALETEFTVVDVYTPFQSAEESPCNAAVTDVTKLNLDFHPNAYGHTLIAEALDETITPMNFTDLSKGQWYYDAVRYAYRNGLMAGEGNNRFNPQGVVTRATVVQVLYNLEGQPEVTEVTDKFSDVKEGLWYSNAITWAVENGVVAGNPDGTFQPTQAITREAFAQMLYNYAVKKGYDVETVANLDKFPDKDQVSSWAYTALAWANGKSVINGTTEGDTVYLAPKDNAIRAQAASILMNFQQNVGTVTE